MHIADLIALTPMTAVRPWDDRSIFQMARLADWDLVERAYSIGAADQYAMAHDLPYIIPGTNRRV